MKKGINSKMNDEGYWVYGQLPGTSEWIPIGVSEASEYVVRFVEPVNCFDCEICGRKQCVRVETISWDKTSRRICKNGCSGCDNG